MAPRSGEPVDAIGEQGHPRRNSRCQPAAPVATSCHRSDVEEAARVSESVTGAADDALIAGGLHFTIEAAAQPSHAGVKASGG
ncbi:MAG: hypothetical protein AB7J63_16775, partial [Vicinamibacterales bacterium]